MRKKIAAALLALLLGVSGAWAEQPRPLRTRDVDVPREGLDPSIPVARGNYDWRVPLKEHLAGEDAPDLFCVRTANESLEELISLGLLADLSADSAVRSRIDRLRPELRRLLTDESGAVYGVPGAAAVTHTVFWIPATWQAAGYDAADAPESLEELLDFLDAWAETGDGRFCVFRIPDDPDARFDPYPCTRWLVDTLLFDWMAQSQWAGQTGARHSAEFVSWLKRAVSVGQKVDQREGGGPNEGRRALFFRNGRGTTESAEETYTLEQLVPPRLFADQPLLLPVSLEVVCVRQDSPWRREAVSLAAASAGHYAWSDLVLYPAGDPAAYNASVSYLPARYTQAFLDSIDRFPGAWIAPTGKTWFDGYDALLARLLSGAISAGEFAAALDAALP